MVLSRRRQWHPIPVLLPGKSMDGGAWWAALHGVAMSWTRLSDFTFTFHFHALEKEMATHSSVLAWRTPRMAEPGGLLSMGSHRVGQDKQLSSGSNMLLYPCFVHPDFIVLLDSWDDLPPIHCFFCLFLFVCLCFLLLNVLCYSSVPCYSWASVFCDLENHPVSQKSLEVLTHMTLTRD